MFIYVLRGYVQTEYGEVINTPSVERYDPLTNEWCDVQAMNTARCGLDSASLGGYLYALGGFNENGFIH